MTPLDRFTNALEANGHRARKSGRGYVSTCPSHDDQSPSLSFREGDKGLIVKCHTGCEYDAICAALNIPMSDLFDDAAVTPYKPRTGDDTKIVATYDYEDERGVLVAQKRRYRDKGYSWRRPVDGGWESGIGDANVGLYRLAGLRKAADAKKAAWWPEGEKDADALLDLGYVAATNPNGAGENMATYAGHFAGCPWVLIPVDSDDPGRRAGAAKASALHERKIACKVLDLAPDRNDGYDVSDYIAEHGDRARELLQQKARTTRAWPTIEKPALATVSAATFMEGIPLYDEQKDYLGPFLHGGYRVHVAGPIGHGKTTFLMEAESAALRGDTFLGWQGRGDLRVLHIDLEMPAELLGQAIHDARLDECNGRFQLLHLPDGLEVDTNPKHRELIEQAAAGGYQILVIDPWYKLLANELEYASGRAVIALFDGIRARHPDLCLVIGFHAQEPQAPNMPVTLGNVSGFKFFQRPADIVLTFQRTKGDQSRVRWEKNRSPRLPVKKGEQWNLEWERGRGFRRAEQKTSADVVFDVLTDEWMSVAEIAELSEKARNHTAEALAKLAFLGRAESRGSDAGGRGQRKLWRRVADGQEAFDVAA